MSNPKKRNRSKHYEFGYDLNASRSKSKSISLNNIHNRTKAGSFADKGGQVNDLKKNENILQKSVELKDIVATKNLRKHKDREKDKEQSSYKNANIRTGSYGPNGNKLDTLYNLSSKLITKNNNVSSASQQQLDKK